MDREKSKDTSDRMRSIRVGEDRAGKSRPSGIRPFGYWMDWAKIRSKEAKLMSSASLMTRALRLRKLLVTIRLVIHCSSRRRRWRLRRPPCSLPTQRLTRGGMDTLDADRSIPTNDVAHSFWYSGDLTPAMQAATNYARQYSMDPTDINSSYTSSSSSADVLVYDQDYTDWCQVNWHPAGDKIGLSSCTSVNSSNACTHADVRYDESFTIGTDVWSQISLACHETGHTLGMEHWDPATDSCMSTVIAPSRNTYSGADVYWINTNYPQGGRPSCDNASCFAPSRSGCWFS